MGVVVNTPSGRLEGERERGAHVFRGIPYAQPPQRGLRFLPHGTGAIEGLEVARLRLLVGETPGCCTFH